MGELASIMRRGRHFLITNANAMDNLTLFNCLSLFLTCADWSKFHHVTKGVLCNDR